MWPTAIYPYHRETKDNLLIKCYLELTICSWLIKLSCQNSILFFEACCQIFICSIIFSDTQIKHSLSCLNCEKTNDGIVSELKFFCLFPLNYLSSLIRESQVEWSGKMTKFWHCPNRKNFQATNLIICGWNDKNCLWKFRKHCRKSRKCWFPTFSPLPLTLSKTWKSFQLFKPLGLLLL